MIPVKRALACATSLALLCSTQPASAEKRASPYRFHAEIEVPILLGASTLWLAPSLANRANATPACDPCDATEVNALDREVIGLYSASWDTAGDVLSGVIPALAGLAGLLHLQRYGWRAWGEDLLLVVEALALSGALNQIVRHAVDRPRPFMYEAGARPELRDQPESFLSFYSGHTSTVFAGAAAFTTSYFIRHPDSRWRWVVLGGAASLSSLMPIARVMAGEHFVTDVLTGTVVGAAIGMLVPLLHRRRGGSGRQLNVGLGATSSAAWATLDARF